MKTGASKTLAFYLNIMFWAGFMAAVSVNSLFQDFAGQQRMRDWVSSHWIDGWVTVPLAAAVLGLCVIIKIKLPNNAQDICSRYAADAFNEIANKINKENGNEP